MTVVFYLSFHKRGEDKRNINHNIKEIYNHLERLFKWTRVSKKKFQKLILKLP